MICIEIISKNREKKFLDQKCARKKILNKKFLNFSLMIPQFFSPLLIISTKNENYSKVSHS